MAEERGEYRTSDTSQPDNVRRLPVRGFTQVDNSYYEGLFGHVSPTAYLCLSYIVRNTVGYHRESVRLSFKQLGDALGLSRNTVMKAMQELEAARIVGSDDTERGRTQVHTYALLPIDGWVLPGTSANNEQDTTSPKPALVVSKNGLVGAQTSPKIGHPINKERKKASKQTDAHASSAATSADAGQPESSRPKAKRVTPTRELSPDHQYRVDLLAAVQEANDRRPTGEHGMEWKAAGMLYAWSGGPAAIDAVVECFTITKRLPKYDTKELHLMDLVGGAKHFAAYLRSGTDAYRRGIERSRAAADGTLTTNARATERAAPQEPRRMPITRGQPLNAKPTPLVPTNSG